MTDKTVAAVSTAPAIPALPPAQYGDAMGLIIAAAGALISALLWLRRRTSRDSTEIAKDRAEENLIGTLRSERDKAAADAREAWAQRTADAQTIARLQTEKEFLEREVSRLEAEVGSLRFRLDQLSSTLNALTNPPAAPA